jgi:hypothetical protein
MCAQIDNQWSHGVVTARVYCYVQSLDHQHRDLHQSTYMYLSKDRDSTSHQVVSDFRFPIRYYRVSSSFVTIFHTEIHQKNQKIYTFRRPIAVEPLQISF